MKTQSEIQRKRLGLVLAVIGMLSMLTVAPYAYGYKLIFDPKNFEKNTEQVLALFEQIERESTQIELQELELAHQTLTLAAGHNNAAFALNTQVNISFTGGALYEPQVQAELERDFPLDAPDGKPGWLQAQRSRWAEVERQRLVELAALQNHLYRDLAPAADRLATTIEASNGNHITSHEPPGLTAVQQSRNELLAMWSGELDRMTALRSVRALVRSERAAREQCEIAYATARREVLMRDWPSTSEGRGSRTR